jgi:hypothetical protein
MFWHAASNNRLLKTGKYPLLFSFLFYCFFIATLSHLAVEEEEGRCRPIESILVHMIVSNLFYDRD